MTNISNITRILSLSGVAIGFLLMSGNFVQVDAQRDPFAKPGYQKTKTPGPASTPGKTGTKTGGPVMPANYGPPPIEARIEYYKRLRETAAANGAPLPK